MLLMKWVFSVRCNTSDVRLLFPRISRCLLSGHSQTLVFTWRRAWTDLASPSSWWCRDHHSTVSAERLANFYSDSFCVWNQSPSLFSGALQTLRATCQRLRWVVSSQPSPTEWSVKGQPEGRPGSPLRNLSSCLCSPRHVGLTCA